MVATGKAEKTIERLADGAAFETWIALNAASSPGIWLQIAKKNSGETTVTYDEALDVALCFGWIDGQKKSFDESFFLQGFTRRTSRSPWSIRNRDKVAVLIEQGRMMPSGMAEIDRAKADGRWDAAYEGQRTAETPQDFLDALAKNPAASLFFETLNSQNKYAVFFRLRDAKKPETRQRRIDTFVQMFAEGKKFH